MRMEFFLHDSKRTGIWYRLLCVNMPWLFFNIYLLKFVIFSGEEINVDNLCDWVSQLDFCLVKQSRSTETFFTLFTLLGEDNNCLPTQLCHCVGSGYCGGGFIHCRCHRLTGEHGVARGETIKLRLGTGFLKPAEMEFCNCNINLPLLLYPCGGTESWM